MMAVKGAKSKPTRLARKIVAIKLKHVGLTRKCPGNQRKSKWKEMH